MLRCYFYPTGITEMIRSSVVSNVTCSSDLLILPTSGYCNAAGSLDRRSSQFGSMTLNRVACCRGCFVLNRHRARVAVNSYRGYHRFNVAKVEHSV